MVTVRHMRLDIVLYHFITSLPCLEYTFDLLHFQSPTSPFPLCSSLSPRARRDYWEKLKPASGRPRCPSMSTPDSWGVTKGHADLMQHKEATSQEELKPLFEKAKASH